MARVKRVNSEQKKEKEVDEFRTRGYKIVDQGQYSAKVKEKDWGELPSHGFLFIFTLISAAVLFSAADLPPIGVWGVALLANIGYALYSWQTAEEVLIKVEDTGDSDHSPSRATDTWSESQSSQGQQHRETHSGKPRQTQNRERRGTQGQEPRKKQQPQTKQNREPRERSESDKTDGW